MEKIYEKFNKHFDDLKVHFESVSKETNENLKKDRIKIAELDFEIMRKDFEILQLTQKSLTNDVDALLAVSNALISVIEISNIDFDLSNAKDIVKETKEDRKIIEKALND